MSEEDPYKVEKLEADKKVKREFERDADEAQATKPYETSNFLLVALATTLRRASSFFPRATARENTLSKADSIYDTLIAFKHQLAKLKENDHTTDAHYTQILSELWHHLLEHFEALNFRNPDRIRFKHLIETLNTFPPDEHRSLGFYLTNYAGDEWLPFPFLDILRHLFRDYLTKKEKSNLAELLRKIDSLLSL